MELVYRDSRNPSKPDGVLNEASEPAHKRPCTNIDSLSECCQTEGIDISARSGCHVSESQQPLMRQTILHKLSEPTLFRGSCKWSCLNWKQEDWVDLFSEELLSFRIGSIVHEGISLSTPQWESECKKGEMTYSQFLEWMDRKRSCLTNCKDEVTSSDHWAYYDYVYMKDLLFVDKMANIVDWGLFGFPERGVKESTLWIGTLGANTPCHIDTYGCNLVAQIVGRKRWVLFPKSQSHYLSPTRVPYEESSIYSEVGFPRPNTTTHPGVSSSTPYLVTLEPGDVLFVPKQWWHSVESLEYSISINTWLELPSDGEERVKESLVRYQVASLCQGVHSLNLISDVFNPNMTDLAIMSPTQHLDLLLHSIFDSTEVSVSHSQGNLDASVKENLNIFTEMPYNKNTEEIEAVRENVPCIQVGIPLSNEPVPCVSFSQYMHEVYGYEVGLKSEVVDTVEEKLHNEAKEFKRLKLLINAFTDQRVIDVLKAVIDEKQGR